MSRDWESRLPSLMRTSTEDARKTIRIISQRETSPAPVCIPCACPPSRSTKSWLHPFCSRRGARRVLSRLGGTRYSSDQTAEDSVRVIPLKRSARGAAAVLILATAARAQQTQPRAVRDPGVVTTGQQITPAGVQSIYDGRVFGVAFGR